jgi:hypothetical protein
MWSQIVIQTKIMFIEVSINSKHEQLWNTNFLVIGIHDDFMLSSFEYMMPFFKTIQNSQKFFLIMNFIIYFNRKNIEWRRLQSPSCENPMLNAKLEVLLVKINGLERSTWIKKWCRHEKNLQRLKGKLYFKSQNKSLIFSN